MDFANVQAALEQRAKQQWVDHKLSLDDRPMSDLANTKYFIRHNVLFAEGESTSLGTGYYRYPGVQYLSVFYRPGEGRDSMLKIVDAIVRYYTDLIVNASSDVVFSTASFFALPVDEKGFAQFQIVCPFYFDYRR